MQVHQLKVDQLNHRDYESIAGLAVSEQVAIYISLNNTTGALLKKANETVTATLIKMGVEK